MKSARNLGRCKWATITPTAEVHKHLVTRTKLYSMGPLIAALPAFGTVFHVLDKFDPRQPESWRSPQERNILLMRAATSTRREYEGQGLMSLLARHLMRTAAAKGYKYVNIECINDRVTRKLKGRTWRWRRAHHFLYLANILEFVAR